MFAFISDLRHSIMRYFDAVRHAFWKSYQGGVLRATGLIIPASELKGKFYYYEFVYFCSECGAVGSAASLPACVDAMIEDGVILKDVFTCNSCFSRRGVLGD